MQNRYCRILEKSLIIGIINIGVLLSITASTCANTKDKNKLDDSINSETNSKSQTPIVEAKEKISTEDQQKSKTNITVYLFHGTYRCRSCRLMEEITIEAINENFAKEKEEKSLIFEDINVEEPKNNHFINDYKLTSISIIISKKSDGKEKEWKNLNQVWMLLGDRTKFKDYIVKEIKSYL
ncbi:MAG: nitrophenyl compound nitroreductase subunit ArsF family protein [Chitinispirillaceae bacterium]|nr:nitrophenyl compound nitroreductase subunit ArsF family protein [Chitinispirillaceae bacterium]